MTVIDALKQTTDENGNIIIPVGATHGESEVPGVVTEEWLRQAFGYMLDYELPLSYYKWDKLRDKLPGQWELNWQWYRDNHVITVA